MDNQQAEPKYKAENKLQVAELLILAVVLLIGLSLRGSYLLEIIKSPDFTVPMVNAAYHDYWARGLANDNWSPPEGLEDPKILSTPYFRPPGYPYFLALVYLLSGSSFLAVRIVQMGLGLVNSVLAYILGRGLFGRAVGLILASLMSVYWIFIFFEGELLAPVLVIFCSLSLMNILCLWTAKFTYLRGIAAGVLCGLFALFRPNILLFVPVVLLWAWWLARRRNDRRHFRTVAAGFLVSTAVVIAPVTLRNYLVADDFVLITSNMGINLYIGNNEQADCTSAKITGLKEMAGLENWTDFTYPEIVHRVEIILGRPVKHSEASSYFAKKAFGYIYENPLKVLGLILKKTALFWGPAEVSNNKEIICAKQQSVVLRYIPGFPAVVSLFVLGLLQLLFGPKAQQIRDKLPQRVGQRQFEVSVLILFFIGTYFVSYLPFFVSARFRVPVIPFLLLFGAYGLYSIGQYIRSKDFRRAVFWAVVWIILYVLATRQVIPYKGYPARWYYYRAKAYSAKGQFDLAIKEYHKALQVAPASAWAHHYLAIALGQEGNLSEATEYYYNALRIKPDLLTARFNLGVVLYQQGKTNEAINHWIKVIQFNPYHADAHNYLGLAFYKLGNINKAIEYWGEAMRLRGDWAEARNNLAWVLATAEDEKLRNPGEAVRLAMRACELTGYNQPGMLDTLGVAYAAGGDFPEAIKTAEKALELARSEGQDELVLQIQEHLKLFKSGQPYREGLESRGAVSR